jgi:hypothetical protein
MQSVVVLATFSSPTAAFGEAHYASFYVFTSNPCITETLSCVSPPVRHREAGEFASIFSLQPFYHPHGLNTATMLNKSLLLLGALSITSLTTVQAQMASPCMLRCFEISSNNHGCRSYVALSHVSPSSIINHPHQQHGSGLHLPERAIPS